MTTQMPPFHVVRVTSFDINARFPKPVWGYDPNYQTLRDLRPVPGFYVLLDPARGIRAIPWDLWDEHAEDWSDRGGLDFDPLNDSSLGPYDSSEDAHNEAMLILSLDDDEEVV